MLTKIILYTHTTDFYLLQLIFPNKLQKTSVIVYSSKGTSVVEHLTYVRLWNYNSTTRNGYINKVAKTAFIINSFLLKLSKRLLVKKTGLHGQQRHINLFLYICILQCNKWMYINIYNEYILKQVFSNNL